MTQKGVYCPVCGVEMNEMGKTTIYGITIHKIKIMIDWFNAQGYNPEAEEFEEQLKGFKK